MSTQKIENPYDTDTQAVNHSSEETMDATWGKEVDQAKAQETLKRNSAPGGTYVTDPSEYEPIVTTGKDEEKDKDGNVTGTRLVASVIARATARIKGKGQVENRDVTQIIRFKVSPESRLKKIYNEANQWTGEFDPNKDDMATRLWANAVQSFEEKNGKGPFTGQDILHYLASTPIALRCMQGDRGDLIVLQIQNRSRRRG